MTLFEHEVMLEPPGYVPALSFNAYNMAVFDSNGS